MNDETEKLLARFKPTGAPPDARLRVLAAVERELAMPDRLRWELWSSMAVAAALLVGVVLNAMVSFRHDARMASIVGPSHVPHQQSDSIRSAERSVPPLDALTYYRRIVTFADSLSEVRHEETAQEDRAHPRPDPRRPGGGGAYYECDRRLHYG